MERVKVEQLPNLKPTYEFPVFRFSHSTWPNVVDICEMSEKGAKSFMLATWKHDQKKEVPKFPAVWPGFEGDAD